MEITLLEDDVALHRAIKEILEHNGFIVHSFFNGETFIEEFSNQKSDLFLLDINVPGIDGLTILESLYRFNPYTKAIIISANSDIAMIEKAYEKGCVDYLKKPFHLKELLLKIQRYVPKLPSLKEGEKLTKKELALLDLLTQNALEAVSYELIQEVVYGSQKMSIDALRALIKRLRNKLQSAKIVAVPQIGYKIERRTEFRE